MNSETRQCQSCAKNFTIDSEDFAFYKKISVPPPTWCPDCRFVRRGMFWNEHNLFRKPDARTGEETFSTYPKSVELPVYEHDYWWSDNWDQEEHAREYDFEKTFFEQFHELSCEMPWPSRSIQRLVHSDYSNQASDLKNCYLVFNANQCEDSMYGVGAVGMRESLDFYHADDCELSYELIYVGHSYQTHFSWNSFNCRNSWFLRDCKDCSYCFGCANLDHQKYHIWNEPYTKEEYEKKLQELNLGSYRALVEAKEKVRTHWMRYPYRFMHGYLDVNVIGEHLYRSKNAHYCYQSGRVENSRYIQNAFANVADSYDYTNWGHNVELMYESISCGEDNRNLKFCFDCYPACEALEYCMNCHSSSNLFGCVGLKKKEYCILNTQYSKGEFSAFRKKIIAHMNEKPYKDAQGRVYAYGEFFPSEFSPLAYNETIAYDYFPLSKDEAEQRGFLWREPELKEFETSIRADELPDHIQDADKSTAREIVACQVCRRAYRFLPQEFAFYKRFEIPLPRLCHMCRLRERTKVMNPMKWWKRKCECAGLRSVPQDGTGFVYKNTSAHFHGEKRCPNEFMTPYAPERKEIVYCEECYQQEAA